MLINIIKKAEEFDNKIQVIPGMELSCKYTISSSQSVEIHMLGYRYDIHNKKLIATLEDISNERDERNRKMCSNLQNAGFPISYDMLCERFGDTILTRAHFARLKPAVCHRWIMRSVPACLRTARILSTANISHQKMPSI